MRIEVKEKLQPYSHTPGQRYILPLTSWSVKIFPTRIEFHDLSQPKSSPYTFDLLIHGPIQNFTSQLDLERGIIKVWGIAAEGYFQYQLKARGSTITLVLNRASFPLAISSVSASKELNAKDTYNLITGIKTLSLEDTLSYFRISFGAHKAQDWDLIKRRQDLTEILPPLFLLSQQIPKCTNSGNKGIFSLLSDLEEKAKNKEKTTVGSSLLTIFNVGLKGVLFPSLIDDEHLGITEEPSIDSSSPLEIIQKYAEITQRLFIEFEGGQLKLLPCLPNELHSGRLIDYFIPSIGYIHLEWSKKLLQKVAFYPTEDITIKLECQKALKRCRLRLSPKEKGSKLSLETPLILKKGQPTFLDNFEK